MNEVDLLSLFTMMKGEPGTRKSTCALSYPTPQYWVSTDKKMKALVKPMKNWGVNPREIHYDDYSDWDKPKAKIESLQVTCPFKTIIIDSITSIGDNMTGQVKKAKKFAKGDEAKGKMIGGIQVSGLEEFNAESSAFQELIAMLKDIQSFHHVNIIMIAHVIGIRKDNDANKLTHHSRRIVTGAEQISAKLASYMEETYHFNVEPSFEADAEGGYSLLTVHTGNDYARTSLPLPSKINFNNDPLYDKWIRPGIENLKNQTPIQRTIPTQPTQEKPNASSFIQST